MNKKNFTLDFINYHFTKLKRTLVIAFTNIILIYYKRRISDELILIMKANRDYLKGVNEFLPKGEYHHVHNNYGIQNYIYNNLENEIDLFPTYTDILVLLLKELNVEDIIYLEIGTSVFKNFQQIENSLTDSILYGYDMNDLIERIQKKYNLESMTEEGSNQEYFHSEEKNEIFYFKNNVLSEKGAEVFKNLLKDKINVVFSDALHSEEGIISEYENIVRNNLSKEFIYYFDDLNMNDVQSGVEKVFKDIKIKNEKARFYSFWTYGWIGQYEKLHKIGLITTLDINSLLKEKKLSLPLFKEVTNV